MAIIKAEEIVGYWTGNQNSQLACTDCVTDAELKDITEEQIVTQDEIEDGENLYFCDRCKKQI